MTKVSVVNKKNNVEGIAVELESGRFAVTENGNTKEVAASTFKRWYKVIAEIVEPAVTVEELLEGGTVVESTMPEVNTAVHVETRGGKTEKFIVNVAFNNVNLVITEYDGYVCDVQIVNPSTGEVEYRSAKMSIKDALEHLGFEGQAMKDARKYVSQMKKAAKLSLIA